MRAIPYACDSICVRFHMRAIPYACDSICVRFHMRVNKFYELHAFVLFVTPSHVKLHVLAQLDLLQRP